MMRVDPTKYGDVGALQALGAVSIFEIRDPETDALVGYDVTPDIDLAGYIAATAVSLGKFKDALKGQVDDRAETLRLSLITPGSGQAMEYQESQSEAAAVLALADPSKADPAAYPMLAASIGIDNDPATGRPTTDVAGEARSVDAARRAWLVAGSAIREIRLKGKDAIDAAATQADARSAFDAIVWPKLTA